MNVLIKLVILAYGFPELNHTESLFMPILCIQPSFKWFSVGVGVVCKNLNKHTIFWVLG